MQMRAPNPQFDVSKAIVLIGQNTVILIGQSCAALIGWGKLQILFVEIGFLETIIRAGSVGINSAGRQFNTEAGRLVQKQAV